MNKDNINTNIFEFCDYKEFLKQKIKKSQNKGRGLVKKFSEKLNIHPTLLSQVLRTDKNLSLENSYKLALLLELTSDESCFFILLVQSARAGSVDLKKFFDDQIKTIQKEKKKLVNIVREKPETLKLDDLHYFYLNADNIIVWLLCSTQGGQSAESLAKLLNLKIESISKTIAFLQKLELLNLSNGKYTMNEKTIVHLPAESPVIHAHHRNWRLKAMEMHPRIKENDFVLTAPLSLSKKSAQIVRKELEKIINTLKEETKSPYADDLYCLNIDWIKLI